MDTLHLPNRVTIHLTKSVLGTHAIQPYTGSELAIIVRTFARQKNDYVLGPFFSDQAGIVSISERQLQLSVQAALDWGLMDYVTISDAFPLIEIRPWWKHEIAAAISARTTGHYTSLCQAEIELWGNLKQYVARLQGAANNELDQWPDRSATGKIRDVWDGTKREYDYSLPVPSRGAAA